MGDKHKVLIIKTGYSEILDDNDTPTNVSLGDILRTTPLLHHFRDDHVTWLTDGYAVPLLEGTPLINRLLTLDFWNSMKLQCEDFSTVVNLEKNLELCELSKKIDSWRKFGFRPDAETGKPMAYDRAFDVLAVGSDSELKRENKKTSQELLFELVGGRWQGQPYVLGYKPSTTEKYDVCLNTKLGPKWPTKMWPIGYWDKLEDLLKNDGFKVSRQDKQKKKILKDISAYIDWINSGRTIVSCDTLGLHLGLALNKKVLGLFGPTPHKEVHFYHRGKAILPDPVPDCICCFKSECSMDKSCMEDISPERVYKEVLELKDI